MLEHVVGPTVGRATAARLLGISHNSLDRWIGKGDVASVITPAGRREVPLAHLVDLLMEVEERRPDHGRMALAAVIRNRRRLAEAIDDDEIFPRRRRARTHRTSELRSLAYHRLVARKLDDGLVGDASRRLQRWRAEDRIHEHWADAWERALELPHYELARLISSDAKHARELRQSSPFAGALTEQERHRALRAADERALA
jgi:hypothetical protein